MSKLKLFCITIILIAISGVFIYLGASSLVDNIDKDKNYIEIQATVVEIIEKYRSGNRYPVRSTSYTEVVEYEVLGQKYFTQNPSLSETPEKCIQIGEKMTIKYNPNSPDKCIFPPVHYAHTIIMFALALAFLGFGIGFFCFVRKEIKQKALQDNSNASK